MTICRDCFREELCGLRLACSVMKVLRTTPETDLYGSRLIGHYARTYFSSPSMA